VLLFTDYIDGDILYREKRNVDVIADILMSFEEDLLHFYGLPMWVRMESANGIRKGPIWAAHKA